MKGADRMKAQFVVIIGDEEIEKRQAVVREMSTSEQTTVAFEEMVTFLEGRLCNA